MLNVIYPKKNDNNKIHIAVLPKGDDIEAKDITVEYRRKREDDFFQYINLDINKSIFMHQIHQVNIAKIDENNINMYGGREKVVEDTDALITNLKNVPLVIQTADCAPVIIYCNATKSMAAIHSSWKGTRDKIVPKTIELMIKEYNAEPSKMYVYIAPYIALKNYEVGEEVAVHFKNKTIINNRWHFDNGLEIKDQMINLGVLKDNIEISDLNTYDKEFYSYRRDGTQIGRMLTLGVII
ncbi:polyphenol oxidase family protein [Brachyspira hampsonii]|uniref:polyphenol oxidase family protein n=1 Tax=Brachyspira hampsonii TaxID=1287055 RepID=UPI001C67874D|nr:polyphenol oxidase family protein [Brachyspira hampsonii]MBW5389687.1 laccase domain-containing protein [Brachyspira hampsonii]